MERAEIHRVSLSALPKACCADLTGIEGFVALLLLLRVRNATSA